MLLKLVTALRAKIFVSWHSMTLNSRGGRRVKEGREFFEPGTGQGFLNRKKRAASSASKRTLFSLPEVLAEFVTALQPLAETGEAVDSRTKPWADAGHAMRTLLLAPREMESRGSPE